MEKEKSEIQRVVDDKYLSAVASDNMESLEKLFKEGVNGVFPDVNAISFKGSSALSIALNKHNKDIFVWLLENTDIDVNIQDNIDETALMLAVKRGKKEYVDLLLENKKTNLDLQNKYGTTALIYACINKFEEIGLSLIKNKADVNIKTNQRTSAILAAATVGSFSLVEGLYKAGANINDKDFYGKDVLINAVSTPSTMFKPLDLINNNLLCKFLIENSADVNYRGPSGINALFLCSLVAHKDIIPLILEAGASPDMDHGYQGVNKMTPLFNVCRYGDVKSVDILLNHGADINFKTSQGNTPMSMGFVYPNLRQKLIDANGDVNAIIYDDFGGKIPIVSLVITGADENIFEQMLNKGVNLKYNDEKLYEYEPLRLAIATGLSKFVSKIIDHTGENLNELWKSKNWEISPLMFLVSNKNTNKLSAFLQKQKLLELLLNSKQQDANGDVGGNNLSDDSKKELQDELSKFKEIEGELLQNKKEMFDILISHGADVNFQDKNGKTALFYASDSDNFNLLFAHGADFFHKNIEGDIPLSYAIKTGNASAIDILFKYAEENKLMGHQDIKNLFLDLVYSAPEDVYASRVFLQSIGRVFVDRKEMLAVVDADGNTPLIIASATNQGAVSSWLLEMGVDINAKNNAGEVALFHAIGSNNTQLVEYYIEKNANLKLTTNDGKNALDFAKEIENEEIFALIFNKLNPEPIKEIETGVRKIKIS